jgi:DNA-binding transcriptional regulator YiaG
VNIFEVGTAPFLWPNYWLSPKNSQGISFAIAEKFCYGFCQEVPMAKLDMRLLAERLRAMREAHGLSQTALAARADLNLGNVNEIEQQRKRSVGADTIVAPADALGVSADYLLGLTDTPPLRKRPRSRKAAPVG